jgi:hypothetical protein
MRVSKLFVALEGCAGQLQQEMTSKRTCIHVLLLTFAVYDSDAFCMLQHC